MEVPIIGLAGAARAGKDTVGNALAIYLGYGVYKFADPIYECIELITGMSYDAIQTCKESELPGFGKSPRYMLQTLGTEWGRDLIDPDIWVTAMATRVYSGKAIITDVRFKNEARWIKSQGGVVIYVLRPAEELEGIRTPEHASENGLGAGDCDITYLNHTSVEGIRARIPSLYESARAIGQQRSRLHEQ